MDHHSACLIFFFVLVFVFVVVFVFLDQTANKDLQWTTSVFVFLVSFFVLVFDFVFVSANPKVQWQTPKKDCLLFLAMKSKDEC